MIRCVTHLLMSYVHKLKLNYVDFIMFLTQLRVFLSFKMIKNCARQMIFFEYPFSVMKVEEWKKKKQKTFFSKAMEKNTMCVYENIK